MVQEPYLFHTIIFMQYFWFSKVSEENIASQEKAHKNYKEHVESPLWHNTFYR